VLKARLAGIDAPEKTQPFGVDSRKRLEALLASGRVSATALKLDGFGRWIVTIEVDGQDLGETLIREGLAWYFRKYERDLPKTLRPRYDAAEAQARRNKKGLWTHEDPLAPWAYRQKRSR
jgi:endonuclease YncB( thermonuclease family)